MSLNWLTSSRGIALATLFAGSALTMSVHADGPPSDADKAIAIRKAAYTLIGNSFSGIGGVLQGKTSYDSAEALKRAERVAFLASIAGESYPEISQTGNTRAKPEIWSNRAEFDKRQQAFVEHANALVQQVSKNGKDEEGFKNAAKVLAGDCKSCHDDFRAK